MSRRRATLTVLMRTVLALPCCSYYERRQNTEGGGQLRFHHQGIELSEQSSCLLVHFNTGYLGILSNLLYAFIAKIARSLCLLVALMKLAECSWCCMTALLSLPRFSSQDDCSLCFLVVLIEAGRAQQLVTDYFVPSTQAHSNFEGSLRSCVALANAGRVLKVFRCQKAAPLSMA